MSQRLGGLAESLLRLGSGGGEGAGRAGSGGEPESASSALAAVAASADEEGSAPTFFNPTGTVSSNESTPRMQQAIVGSPFPFLLRQQPHHHHRGRQGGDAHAPATTTTGFAAPASFSSAASLEEPLLSVEGVPQTAAAAPEFGDLEAGKRNGEQRRAAAEAGATGPTEQQQEPAAAAATAGSASASASAAADAASAKRLRTKELVTSLVYGAINALVGLPTLVSFSIIVYGTRAVYRPYVPPPLRCLPSHRTRFSSPSPVASGGERWNAPDTQARLTERKTREKPSKKQVPPRRRKARVSGFCNPSSCFLRSLFSALRRGAGAGHPSDHLGVDRGRSR